MCIRDRFWVFEADHPTALGTSTGSQAFPRLVSVDMPGGDDPGGSVTSDLLTLLRRYDRDSAAVQDGLPLILRGRAEAGPLGVRDVVPGNLGIAVELHRLQIGDRVLPEGNCRRDVVRGSGEQCRGLALAQC
eukprot:4754001-Alexandrium_andersonii.AAC.1